MNNTNTATNDSEINTLSALTEADQEGYDQFIANLDRDCDEWDAAHQPDEQDDDSDDDEHGFNREPREDNFRDDVDADANVLAGAGYGTDEDYGYFGEDNGWD